MFEQQSTLKPIKKQVCGGTGLAPFTLQTQCKLCKTAQKGVNTLNASSKPFHTQVCGGTGLAPFLGLIAQRAADAKGAAAPPALTTLYFGCRGEHDEAPQPTPF